MAADNAKIVFRVDASIKIGTGHVMRCLTLANALGEIGYECVFVCREHPGNLIAHITAQGFRVEPLPRPAVQPEAGDSPYAPWLGANWQTDAAQTRAAIGEATASWLIVDHYALDNRWEAALHGSCDHLMVIDDLADRPHACDLLLDQNLGREEADYAKLVDKTTALMIGPRYALLRPEFAALRPFSIERRSRPQLKTLLITMGGVDRHNITGQVLDALKRCDLPKDLKIQVVMGQHAPMLSEVKHQAQTMPWSTEVLVNVSNMAQMMAESDLAIGAAGSTSWERCCLGLPSITVILADNQVEAAQALMRLDAVCLLNSVEDLPACLGQKRAESEFLLRLSNNAASIIDGLGTGRILREITQISSHSNQSSGRLRPVKDSEIDLMLNWRNDPKVRANMYTHHVISHEEHLAWWRKTKNADTQKYFVYWDGNTPLGIVAFTDIQTENAASWAFYAAPIAPAGTGSKMEFLALDYVFNILKLCRLNCEVLGFNTPVINLHHKFGFTTVEIHKNAHMIDGEGFDIHKLQITREAWNEKRATMLERIEKR